MNASAFIQLQEWRYKKDNVFERANATDLVTDTPGRFIEYENELPSPGPAPVVILYTDYALILWFITHVKHMVVGLAKKSKSTIIYRLEVHYLMILSCF